jgi:hypothetical protein
MKASKAQEIATFLAGAQPAQFFRCRVTDENGRHAYYDASLEDANDGGREIAMAPCAGGSIARARSQIAYCYDKGGSMFRAAFEAGRLIESYLPAEALV